MLFKSNLSCDFWYGSTTVIAQDPLAREHAMRAKKGDNYGGMFGIGLFEDETSEDDFIDVYRPPKRLAGIKKMRGPKSLFGLTPTSDFVLTL